MSWNSFGLLHGLGFAGALTEIGLPENEVPLALATFKIGIEVGFSRQRQLRAELQDDAWRSN